MNLCSTPGCAGGTRRRRGLCDVHYQRWRTNTPPSERRAPTPTERFISKVDRRGPDECWPWTGVVLVRGYGRLVVNRKRVPAHRFAYLLAYGVEPDHVDHLCHNNSGCAGGNTCLHRRCCNPAHLESTTNLINLLRGEGPSAHHARQTHCVNGHEFSTENTYWYSHRGKRPRRECRRCKRANSGRKRKAT